MTNYLDCQKNKKDPFLIFKTVICHGLQKIPPKFVLQTLSLGPRNPVLERFNQNEILAELDSLMEFCKNKNIDEETLTNINIKTLTYIKNCKKQKTPRNLMLTRQYLKENSLLAIPFDKGIGICIMTLNDYNDKLKKITNLPQFKKVESKRKNEKNPIVKEEERIVTALKDLHRKHKINDSMLKKLLPRGSQPPRLYGLAKVHKKDTPLRPVLSMPGSPYHAIATQMADWLSVVGECKINSSTERISTNLRDIQINEDEQLISFDIVSLYTNVPVLEAINDCTNLLYSGNYQSPPISRDTFKELLTLCCSNVLLLTNEGYFRQTDGLAMGSPPAPHLANAWLSKFDTVIRDDAKLFSRYMDDILREIKKSRTEEKLVQLNNLHPSLKFTIEEETENSITFLDMRIIRENDGSLHSTWFTKETDTGLIMNYHALAPIRYKKSVISGLIHRIYRACTSWKYFHESLEKAKIILQKNQYPPSFYEEIIRKVIEKLIEKNRRVTECDDEKEEKEDEKLVFIQYRGKVSDQFGQSLKKQVPLCKIIFTIRKLKTCLPSLKPDVEPSLKSKVVYKIVCPCCQACYVGQTSRHLLYRVREHKRKNSPVGEHFQKCNSELTMENVKVIASTFKSINYLMTLEALFIKDIKPTINTKDEYRSRALVIKI